MVRLTDRPDMTIDLYRGQTKTTTKKTLSSAWSLGDQLMVCFCCGISLVLFDTLGISRCHSERSGGAMVLG